MILALYLRLSKEDGDMADESNSIKNQRFILRRYVEQRQEFDSYEIKEYIDDGFSGKNFERPGIQNLLEAVKTGKVYGIIVKDFSRFGRNYIETGNYIEKIFPLLEIRFIAVNNSYDSEDYIGTAPDMDTAFENLMYDYFSEENSMKVKNDLMNRRMRGSYIADFAAFGYKKCPSDHNRIIIDEKAASIVRIIFEKYAETGVKAEVARYLNDRGIPTPQVYAIKNGSRYKWKYEGEKKLWNSSIIGRILKNQIYIGNTVFHKKEVVETGSKKIKCLPEKEWKICENTHEPIIPKGLFELVNRKTFGKSGMIKPENRECLDRTAYCEGEKRNRGRADSPIKGLVKCGGCRHNMQRRNRLNASYYCRYYYEAKSEGCCSENVKEARLLEVVLSVIRHQVILEGGAEKLQDLYRQQLDWYIKAEQEKRQQLENKLQNLADTNFLAYESYVKGEMTAGEFIQQKEDNNRRIKEYQTQMQCCQIKETVSSDEKYKLFCWSEGKEMPLDLTKELARELIDSIYVYSGKCVEIVLKVSTPTCLK